MLFYNLFLWNCFGPSIKDFIVIVMRRGRRSREHHCSDSAWFRGRGWSSVPMLMKASFYFDITIETNLHLFPLHPHLYVLASKCNLPLWFEYSSTGVGVFSETHTGIILYYTLSSERLVEQVSKGTHWNHFTSIILPFNSFLTGYLKKHSGNILPS